VLSGRSWIHPESLFDRLRLEHECVSKQLAFARYDGRFLRQSRHLNDTLEFVSFRATELINFMFDDAGVPASIVSFYVDIRPDDALDPDWAQYLSDAKPMSPQAIAAASRVFAPCRGDLLEEEAVYLRHHEQLHKKSPTSLSVRGIASASSISDTPDVIVVNLEGLWEQVCGSVWIWLTAWFLFRRHSRFVFAGVCQTFV
jgi:hypothetical protein